MTNSERNGELTNEQRLEVVRSLGLSIEAAFVPWSQSRNREEKHRSLNWRVTVLVARGGAKPRAILTTDYSAGIGHAPSYVSYFKTNFDKLLADHAIAAECETGYRHVRGSEHSPDRPSKTADKIEFDELGFWASLTMDADVLNYRDFEDWAGSLGFDTDSRRADRAYSECVRHAIALRADLGDDGLQKLREAFIGY